MHLTLFAIQNAKAKEKPYRLADSDGLYLLVHQRQQTLAVPLHVLRQREHTCVFAETIEITTTGARRMHTYPIEFQPTSH